MGYSAIVREHSFYVKPENTGRVLKKLENYGYEAEVDDDGSIIGVDFIAHKLAHDEDTMFQAIAPYVKDGSYIEMGGEDGDLWRWIFKDGTCKEIHAIITWPDE